MDLGSPEPRIPDSTRKLFPDFGFHGQHVPGFRNPDYLSRGIIVSFEFLIYFTLVVSYGIGYLSSYELELS